MVFLILERIDILDFSYHLSNEEFIGTNGLLAQSILL
jgi:hypothetical protein